MHRAVPGSQASARSHTSYQLACGSCTTDSTTGRSGPGVQCTCTFGRRRKYSSHRESYRSAVAVVCSSRVQSLSTMWHNDNK